MKIEEILGRGRGRRHRPVKVERAARRRGKGCFFYACKQRCRGRRRSCDRECGNFRTTDPDVWPIEVVKRGSDRGLRRAE